MTRWIYLFLQLVFLLETADATQNVTLPARCSPAQSQVAPSEISKNCIPYQLPDKGYCRHIVKWPVMSDRDQQKEHDDNMERFHFAVKVLEDYLKLTGGGSLRKSCEIYINEVFCHHYYPKCDATTAMLRKQQICRKTCEKKFKVCDRELAIAKDVNRRIQAINYPFYWDILNCTIFPARNGGTSPKCYYPRHLNTETDKLKSSECFYGNGLGYLGNVSVTISGHVCQEWSSQCPHRHDHPLAEYPELVNASNWCRNPGGQAPNGPWCYTSSKTTRWEYCGVRKCPPPAPSLAPLVTVASSAGPYKIFLEWKPVPLPFVHGTPYGFRIQFNKVDDQVPTINTTSPSTTYFEIRKLKPLTNYSLSVLEFNENGNGPWSAPVYVMTMPQNFVAIKLTFVLKNQRFDSALVDRSRSRYKKLEKRIKAKIMKFLQSTKPQEYKIFKMSIVRFLQVMHRGSVGVELDITAELINAAAWKATQSITGKIMEGAQSKLDGPLAFTSLHVQARPSPPVNLTQSHVTLTSATIGWSAPAFNEPYNITNYTVQYKKEGTTMQYNSAAFVGREKRKVTVENLDSNTRYLMRVVSVNAYGQRASEDLPVRTEARASKKGPSVAAIASPLALMSAVLIIVGVLFLRWCHKKKNDEMKLRERIQRLMENPYDSEVDWFKLFKIDVVKPWWEIPRDDLMLENQLGSGAFGVVLKGFLKRGEDGKEHGRYCAVKMLKENPTEGEVRDLCKEINIMSTIGDHPNIVSIIGACTINGPPLLVVKFAPNGCLLDYLKENRPLPDYENQKTDGIRKVITEKERLKFAHEIAQGMSHLEKHRYVHRDLAARNILLGKNMVAMVADFGLSRDIYELGVYEKTTGGRLPVRWMAPESLQELKYSTVTDVWSYGILLWEMETGGLVPYGGLGSGQEILAQLKQGYRLEKPHNTSRDLYAIMWKCWNPDPNQRPTFFDLVYQVNGLLAAAKGDQGHNNEAMKEDQNDTGQLGTPAFKTDTL